MIRRIFDRPTSLKGFVKVIYLENFDWSWAPLLVQWCGFVAQHAQAAP